MLRTMICLLLLTTLSQAAGPPAAQVAKLTSGTFTVSRRRWPALVKSLA
jgi:hypothetical protein